MEIKDYATMVVSVLMLLINIFFYIIIAPRINYRLKSREKMYELCCEYLDYLVLLTSFDNFDGVPTNVRSYSVRLQLMYKDGKAPDEMRELLEKIFHQVKERKKFDDESSVNEWQDEMRKSISLLRMLMSKYKNQIRW